MAEAKDHSPAETNRQRLDRLAALYDQLDQRLRDLESRLEDELPQREEEPRPKPR